ncbi:MAG: Mut7-C RNAse domain-containing protein [Bacteroidales bacterium]
MTGRALHPDTHEVTPKTAWFRFYEELNDFLPAAKRKTDFPYRFSGTPSVKDAIEAIGIPHGEVDMIIVNGNQAGFTFRLSNNDHVSVYPVFESLDISGTPLRAKPLRKTMFVLDVHLGRLAKYLRLCGFDTLFEAGLTDPDIIEVSVREKRIILTRDRGLLKNKKVTHGYWIRSSMPRGQLTEVLERFDLKNNLNPFTRCLECNGELIPVTKEKVAGRLMPQTRELFNDFRICTVCGKVYWEGSHYESMRKFIRKITEGPV